ncbi:MAG: hypothetical protein ABJB11_21325 [Ferruginibacter sp.]
MLIINEKSGRMGGIRSMLVVAFFLVTTSTFSQKINGQWRGYFNSNGDIVLSSGDNTEYVLELEINGSQVTGYSYSYFQNRRYYVICSLKGIYYKSTKSMKVTETARIKGLTPPDWNDCLQTHILSYQKEGNVEELTGRWLTAEGQLGNCGAGLTTLTRRTLSKDLSSFNKSKSDSPFSSRKPDSKSSELVDKNRKPASPPVAKVTPKPKPEEISSSELKTKPVERDIPEMIVPEKKSQTTNIIAAEKNYEKRTSDLVKTIEITGKTIKVDLYDNGDIDGDSVSLFYNGKLLLSHKRLTDKPISFTLEANMGESTNELTMYADNLGLIPPNTALMIITDGTKRYEVRISSDLKKSGTVRFLSKANADANVP